MLIQLHVIFNFNLFCPLAWELSMICTSKPVDGCCVVFAPWSHLNKFYCLFRSIIAEGRSRGCVSSLAKSLYMYIYKATVAAHVPGDVFVLRFSSLPDRSSALHMCELVDLCTPPAIRIIAKPMPPLKIRDDGYLMNIFWYLFPFARGSFKSQVFLFIQLI